MLDLLVGIFSQVPETVHFLQSFFILFFRLSNFYGSFLKFFDYFVTSILLVILKFQIMYFLVLKYPLSSFLEILFLY